MEKEIYKTISRFDFKKVHQAMVLLKWKWWNGYDFTIPTLNEIRLTAINELRQISADLDNSDNVETLCGGFKYVGKRIGDKKYYELYFVLAWSDNYD